jgi:two-component system sensor histidine kinase PrrB
MVTVAVAFVAGLALLAILTSVNDDATEPRTRRERLEQRVEDRGALREVARRRVAVSGLVATGIAGGLGWVLIGVALSPLDRLRAGAAAVAETSDLRRRVPTGEGPEEIDLLARTLNAMLERLEVAEAATRAALDASRTFAADAAHELRTPLTSLQTDISTLDNPTLGADERSEILAEMGEEHTRLVRLLDQLLALARGDTGVQTTMEPIELADLVEVAAQAARRRNPAATIAVTVAGDPHLVGSADGLRLALDNLLENAIRHGGGRIDVEVRSGPDAEALVQIDDHGPGIPAGDRQRVLARFARGAAPTTPGSGLGLALVAQQVALHRGRLELGDAPGGGLRVHLWLPTIEG